VPTATIHGGHRVLTLLLSAVSSEGCAGPRLMHSSPNRMRAENTEAGRYLEMRPNNVNAADPSASKIAKKRLSVISVSITAAAGVIIAALQMLAVGNGQTIQSTGADCSPAINQSTNTSVNCSKTTHNTTNNDKVTQISHGQNSPNINNSTGVNIGR
jgi:hypothetical protein